MGSFKGVNGFGDSIDKIVKSYFGAVTSEPFDYKGEHYPVPPLTISATLLRGYTCPAFCGACCGRYSMDYLPSEVQPFMLKENGGWVETRTIPFNGRDVMVYSDLQVGNDTDRCHHLSREDGRCGIYLNRGFSCDFELIRVIRTWRSARIGTQLYSRGWNMRRIDGSRGAMCEILPADQETISDMVRKLHRLTEWTDYFGLPTRLPEILEWIESVRYKDDLETLEPLRFPGTVVEPVKDEDEKETVSIGMPSIGAPSDS